MTAVRPIDTGSLDQLGAPVLRFEAGEKIFLADETARAMFVVRSGRVDVIIYGAVLENIRAGGIFGEMSLIDDEPRSAAAIAAEPTEVSVIDQATFMALIRADADFALNIMRLLSARVRRMNDQF